MAFLPHITYPADFAERKAKRSTERTVSARSYSLTEEETFYTNFLETSDWEKRPTVPAFQLEFDSSTMSRSTPERSFLDAPDARKTEWDWVDARSRYVLYPILYPNLWKMFKDAQGSQWFAEEIVWDDDAYEFEHHLNDDERHFLKLVLAFFAASEGMVGENALVRFAGECPIPEAVFFFQFQGQMECIHEEVYNDAIEKLIVDPEERHTLFRAIEKVPCVQEKARWIEKWLRSDRPFAERLVAFSAVEGIFFSGSFASIFWLKHRGKLTHGLVFSNELISRDEGLHWQFQCELFKEFPSDRRPSADVVREILRSAVEIEDRFTEEALPVRLVGMNEADMKRYIRFVADQIYRTLGFEGTIFGEKNPFSFMTFQGVYTKTDFFRGRDSNYRRQRQNPTLAAQTRTDPGVESNASSERNDRAVLPNAPVSAVLVKHHLDDEEAYDF